MAIGPVHLIVLGFEHPSFLGELDAEVERLRHNDAVRVIDTLVVYKDADDELEVADLNGGPDDAGRVVGALIGLGVEGEQDLDAAATVIAETVEAEGDQEAWDVLDDIPRDSAAALLLIEYHWAISLRSTIARAGGFRIADGFISPLDLVVTGLVSPQEAEELDAIEGGTPAAP